LACLHFWESSTSKVWLALTVLNERSRVTYDVECNGFSLMKQVSCTADSYLQGGKYYLISWVNVAGNFQMCRSWLAQVWLPTGLHLTKTERLRRHTV
jgi:hypothetical protein